MANISSVTYDFKNNNSVLAYTIGGNPTREIHYHGGTVDYPSVLATIQISLTDFVWLHTEVDIWLESIRRLTTVPRLEPNPIVITFTIGDYDAPSKTWETTSALTASRFDDTSITFDFRQSRGGVFLLPRETAQVAWSTLLSLNNLIDEFLLAATTGKRK